MAYLFDSALQVVVDDGTGNIIPANGYKSYFYSNRTTTPVTTWQNSSESVTNSHPVTHDSSGHALVYFNGTVSWELKTPAGATVAGWPIHDIAAPVLTATALSDWVATGYTVTRLSDTSFRVSGDQTATLQPSRRVRVNSAGPAVLASITTVSTDGSYTTVTVRTDTAVALPATILSVDVGLVSATQYSGPVPAANQDLIINPHFRGWPEGYSISVTSNVPQHYGADGWMFRGAPGTSETGTIRFRSDRTALSAAETDMCGSTHCMRMRCDTKTGSIFMNGGDSTTGLSKEFALDEVIPWLGRRCYIEVFAKTFSGTYSVTPWVGVYSNTWTGNLVKGTPITLTTTLQRFVIPFTLPAYSAIQGTIGATSKFTITFETYRGTTNPDVAVIGATPYSDFDLGFAAVHMVSSEVFGRPIEYMDSLDKARRWRYFYSSYPDGVAPGTAYGENLVFFCINATTLAGYVRWPSAMLKSPTVKVYAPAAGTANKLEKITDGSLTNTVTSTDHGTNGLVYILIGGGGLTTGELYRCHMTADGRF